MSKPVAIFDIECYRHFFLVCFLEVGGKQRRKHFEFYDGHPLDRAGLIRIMRNYTLVGFNSMSYDVPMLKASLKDGMSNDKLKSISDAIIKRNLRPWETEREFSLPEIKWLDHIDLIEPAPSVNVGLKLYGARLHSKRLQDLPIEPDAVIKAADRPILIDYCYNDLDTTLDLYNHIKPQIELRVAMSEQYGVDLRSKSDAQIAEAVIRQEIERITGDRPEKPYFPDNYEFKYDVPDFIEFQTEQMREVYDIVKNATFKLKKREMRSDEDSDDPSDGSGGVKIKVSGIDMPAEIKGLKIKMGSSVYKMGIGGLHSTEKHTAQHAGKYYILKDADVGAFYPAIKLICELYPEHLGRTYLDIYRSIRERRMDAKHRAKPIKALLAKMADDLLVIGDEIARKVAGEFDAAKRKELENQLRELVTIDMTLKIVLNGAFGKLGSKYSFLYSPKLMLQVTLTGQLVLLMLIETLELAGISVVSANTDGIVSRIPVDQVDEYHEIVRDWEKRTGFEMEFAEYAALYSESVNSYIAVKPDGSVKQKGLYAFVGSKGSPAEKNPKNYVCIDAVIAYLTKRTPLEETIEWCQDVRRFLSVQRVKGGAEFEGQYLGKVVRWYRSTESTSYIQYATGDKKGDKVPLSDHARPMMELTGLPHDLDYDYYVGIARKMLGKLGVL